MKTRIGGVQLLTSAATCVLAAASLAACGAAHHALPKPTTAQCSAASSAVSTVAMVTQPFAGLTSQQGLVGADMQVASNSAATGSADSYAQAVQHAAIGVPGPLARALRQTASDFVSFSQQNNGTGVSYQGVSQAAGFVMSDIAKVQTICP